MNPGGEIRITLGVMDGRVARVDIASSRADVSGRLFRGREIGPVIDDIGRVFSLCGRAQTIAALRAVEAAVGLEVSRPVEAARDALRQAEMISQTAMRLCLYWPRALGLAPEPELVRLALDTERMIEGDMLGGTAWKRPGAGVAAPGAALEDQIERLAEAGEQFVCETPLRHELARRGLAGFGALPEGMAPEEGPLKRLWHDARVAGIRAEHGAGLMARLEAGLAELDQLHRRLSEACATVEPVAARNVEIGSGTGQAEVETARGPLRHEVTLENGVVAGYRIDAPTELNFRTGGPVEAGLIGAPSEGIEAAARLHVVAIDPCVGFEIEVAHA